MISGKVWGSTRLIFQGPFCEMHRAEIKAGTYCSKHMHRHKWNGFYVESGVLKVKAWKTGYDLVDETVLKAGDFTAIAPLEQHQFECIEDAVCFELYWPEFRAEDIVRETVGGGKSAAILGYDSVSEESIKAMKDLDAQQAVNRIKNAFFPIGFGS